MDKKFIDPVEKIIFELKKELPRLVSRELAASSAGMCVKTLEGIYSRIDCKLIRIRNGKHVFFERDNYLDWLRHRLSAQNKMQQFCLDQSPSTACRLMSADR